MGSGQLQRLPAGRPLAEDAGAAAARHAQVDTVPAEQHLDPLGLQIPLDGQIDLLGLFGAQMTDGTVDQLEAGLNGPLADLLDLLFVADALDPPVGAELQIDAVGIGNELIGRVVADQLGQVAAHLGA